jgi:hypothetical protein
MDERSSILWGVGAKEVVFLSSNFLSHSDKDNNSCYYTDEIHVSSTGITA